MEDINKINKQEKIFSVPVTQAINFTTHSHSKHKAVLQEKTVRSLKALNLRHKVTQNPYFASTTQPVHTRQQCSYMGAWASQATVPFIQHICRYVQIPSNIYKRKNRSTKAGHENPQKTSRWKKHGERVPPTKAVVQPLGF